MSSLCIRCGGTGTYNGLGSMLTDCELCNDPLSPPAVDKIDRRSTSYKKAIKDIMDLNPEIGKEEATKIFDDAYQKN